MLTLELRKQKLQEYGVKETDVPALIADGDWLATGAASAMPDIDDGSPLACIHVVDAKRGIGCVAYGKSEDEARNSLIVALKERGSI